MQVAKLKVAYIFKGALQKTWAHYEKFVLRVLKLTNIKEKHEMIKSGMPVCWGRFLYVEAIATVNFWTIKRLHFTVFINPHLACVFL